MQVWEQEAGEARRMAMPDIFTTRPDIVKQVLKDAGLEAHVQPTIIKDRPAEITYRFNGKGYYAELYVHDLAEVSKGTAFPDAASLAVGFIIGAVAVTVIFLRRSPQS